MSFLKDTFDIIATEKLINYYRSSKLFQSMIDSFRDSYEAEVSKVELASKRRRVEELQEMYYSLKASGDLKEAKNMLSQIRTEREGLGEKGDVYQFNQFNTVNDVSLKAKMEENSKLIEQLKARSKVIEVKSES